MINRTVIGIDLGGTTIKIGAVEDGRIVKRLVKPSPGKVMSYEESIIYFVRAIKELEVEPSAIGVGVPSVVDSVRGIVYDAVNIPSWEKVPLKEILEQEFKVPVAINNDANCFAYGEKVFGEHSDCRDLVGVTLGTGLGVGIITGGTLYNGKNTGAGELGNVSYREHNYEYYCSSGFFVSEYGSTGKEMYDRAVSGDVEAVEVWAQFGRHLGEFMKMVLYAYDPEAIVFGGSISKAYELFSRSMGEAMSDFIYPRSLDELKISVSNVKDSGIMGAAALLCSVHNK